MQRGKGMFSSKKNGAKTEILSSKMDYMNNTKTLTDIYELGDLLGQGTNAKVHKAVKIPTLKEKNKKGYVPIVVAVKIMKSKEEIEAENRGRSSAIEEETLFRHEIDVMLHIKQCLPKHKYILELVQVLTYQENTEALKRPCLVLEFLSGGELFDRIVQKSSYTEADAASLFYKLMETLRDLHGAGIVHRDLKPENIIYGDTEEDIKICDFGTAKIVSSKEDIFAEFKVGSPGYFAPETIYKHYDPANDIWSMGCILYTLLAGYMCFDMDDPMLIVKLLTCNYEFHEDPWSRISDDAKDLIRKMLSTPYKDRITAEEVLRHPWFSLQQRRPSAANLGSTLINLKILNDDKEKKKQLMREYFFNNVLSARNKMTQMITASTRGGVRAVQSGLKSVRSRGMSAWSSMSQSSTDLRQKKSMSQNEAIVLKHVDPKNRQDLMTDIRSSVRTSGKFSAGVDEVGAVNGTTEKARGRSSTMQNIIRNPFSSVKSRRANEPKAFQNLLTEIRSHSSVVLTETDPAFTKGSLRAVDIEKTLETSDKQKDKKKKESKRKKKEEESARKKAEKEKKGAKSPSVEAMSKLSLHDEPAKKSSTGTADSFPLVPTPTSSSGNKSITDI